MIFSDEVCNVTEPNQGPRMVQLRFEGISDPMPRMVSEYRVSRTPENAQKNAIVLAAILNSLTTGVVYFPPGRYYVARPPTPSLGETGSDFVVPGGVTLRFAPGAVLVPLTVPPVPMRNPSVQIEVQGAIEAGIYQIFDVVEDDFSLINLNTYDPTRLKRAGLIILTRDRTRQIYPEWWGAAPPPGDFSNGLPAAVARRTTMAFQEAIDVAHTRRSPNHPPIPVVLTGEYVIDQELVAGATISDIERGSPVFNRDHFFLSAGRGPSRAGTGSPVIRAHRSYSAGVRSRTDTAALLAIRGVSGCLIEGITFDSAFVAPRCMTIQSLGGPLGGAPGVHARNWGRELHVYEGTAYAHAPGR